MLTANDPNQELDRKTLRTIVAGINSEIEVGAFPSLSFVLTRANPATMPPSAAIALLRTTFAYRTFIQGWSRFLRLTRESFKNRGLDVEKVLVGLA